MTKLGLIGTRFTMDEPRIIAGRLREKFGLEVITPDDEDRAVIDVVIQTELVKGIFRDDSRARYRAIMAKLVAAGCEAIVLGCTEIPLLVKAEDATVPLYDTMHLHARAIADFALD
jgi:aspartate racemase